VSISSFKVCKAKTLSSGSSSDKKPSTPDAEVKPGMVKNGIYRNKLDLELMWPVDSRCVQGEKAGMLMGWIIVDHG
jgi:hypothetical protein